MSAAQPSLSTEPRRISVRDGYTLWAASYDHLPNPLLHLENRVMAGMLPDVSNRRVLDVGCGTGRWMQRLAEMGAKAVFGLDASPQMLNCAAGKVSLNARLLRGDCRQLPIRAGSIDLAVCSFVAGYLCDLGNLLRELSRIATPRAEIFLSDIHPSCYSRGWKRTFRHGGEVFEITNTQHSITEILRAGHDSGLRLAGITEPHWDEPERPIFEMAGKRHLFEAGRPHPALYILQFRPLPTSLRV